MEINRNIEQLSEKFRVPFKMFIDGYKYTEIAEELDIKIGTVKKQNFPVEETIDVNNESGAKAS